MTKAKHLHSTTRKPQIVNDDIEIRLQQAKQSLFISTDPKYTARQASRDYDVPYDTLRNRLKGIKPRKKAHEAEMLLNEAEKKVLVDWIRYLGLAGIPVCKRTLRPKVKGLMEAKGLTVTENSVSPSWIRTFLQQNKDALKAARGSSLDPKRAQAFNFPIVNAYFEELDQVLKKDNIP